MSTRQARNLLLLFLIAATFACGLPGREIGGRPPGPENSTATATTATFEPQPAGFMDRYTIITADYPAAVCNDGTTPVFYYRRGVGEGANRWIIWFKGGGSASSAEEYRSRPRNLTSANPWLQPDFERLGSSGNPDSPDGEAAGIMSSVPADNPDFYHWNHVYLVYCSSDSWTGTRAASAQTGGIHFAGHHITNAMFAALQDPAVIGSPNLADATHIILSGSSAGGHGLRANVDRLAALLSHADVKAISDAGVYLLGDPAADLLLEMNARLQAEVWQPALDEDCATDNADALWRCQSGGFLVQNGYIQTPTFFHQDQSDFMLAAALQEAGLDVEQSLMIMGAATRPLLETQDGVFSPNAGQHIILNSNRFSRFRLQGRTFAEVFGNWYFGRPGPTQVIEYP